MSSCKDISETLVSSCCKSEAEQIGELIVEMSQGNKMKLEAFLEAVNFLDKWKEPA